MRPKKFSLSLTKAANIYGLHSVPLQSRLFKPSVRHTDVQNCKSKQKPLTHCGPRVSKSLFWNTLCKLELGDKNVRGVDTHHSIANIVTPAKLKPKLRPMEISSTRHTHGQAKRSWLRFLFDTTLLGQWRLHPSFVLLTSHPLPCYFFFRLNKGGSTYRASG